MDQLMRDVEIFSKSELTLDGFEETVRLGEQRLFAWFENKLKNRYFKNHLYAIIGFKHKTPLAFKQIYQKIGSMPLGNSFNGLLTSSELNNDEKVYLLNVILCVRGRFCIEHGTTTSQNEFGNTVFHYAVGCNSPVTVFELLKGGAGQHIKNAKNETPFEMLVNQCEKQCGVNTFCKHELIRSLFNAALPDGR